MKVLINEKLSEHKFKTPEGYLICTDAILARTGKQTYTKDELFCDGDSTEVDVDRPYNEVMNNKTIASFENKPITFDHPNEDVNIANYKDYAIGYVRDVHQGKTENGEDVIMGNLVITDKDAIEAIENGDHTDLSCGYDCDIVDLDNGYAQHNIRGNHVALCECGRAGNARIVDSRKENIMKDNSNLANEIIKIVNELGEDDVNTRDADEIFKRLQRKYSYVDYEDVESALYELGYAADRYSKYIRQYFKDSNIIKDDWHGTRNGINYWYHNGDYFITHKNGKVERLPESKFQFLKDLYRYIDTIKDSTRDSSISEKLWDFILKNGIKYEVYVYENEYYFPNRIEYQRVKNYAKQIGYTGEFIDNKLRMRHVEDCVKDAFEHTMKIKKSEIDVNYFKKALKSSVYNDIKFVKEDSQYIYVYGDPNNVNYLEFESSINDSVVKDIEFKYLTEAEKALKEALGLYKKIEGRHTTTSAGTREKQHRQNQYNNAQVAELNEAINEAIRNLNEGIKDKSAWQRLAIKLEAWEDNPEYAVVAKKAKAAIRKFTQYISKDSTLTIDKAISFIKLTKKINDSYVEEWWGVPNLDGKIDGDSPNSVAKQYGLVAKLISRKGYEILVRFTGPVERLQKAKNDGYFYESSIKDSKVKDTKVKK